MANKKNKTYPVYITINGECGLAAGLASCSSTKVLQDDARLMKEAGYKQNGSVFSKSGKLELEELKSMVLLGKAVCLQACHVSYFLESKAKDTDWINSFATSMQESLARKEAEEKAAEERKAAAEDFENSAVVTGILQGLHYNHEIYNRDEEGSLMEMVWLLQFEQGGKTYYRPLKTPGKYERCLIKIEVPGYIKEAHLPEFELLLPLTYVMQVLEQVRTAETVLKPNEVEKLLHDVGVAFKKREVKKYQIVENRAQNTMRLIDRDGITYEAVTDNRTGNPTNDDFLMWRPTEAAEEDYILHNWVCLAPVIAQIDYLTGSGYNVETFEGVLEDFWESGSHILQNFHALAQQS